MSNNLAFAFRGLEMHGSRMWDPACLHEALDFAGDHGLTALVLHDNSIMHEATFPRRYFDDSKRKGYAHVRRYLSAIYSRQAYLRDLLKRAARKGVEVWVEVKELEFPDELLEKFPQLCKEGNICPTDPIWYEYLDVKTQEFFELFPSMAGIILSPGSPESRAFLSAGRKCTCERCRSTDFGDWCHRIIMAMYGAIKRNGKHLAVRDFVYTPEDHERLARVMERVPDDVAFSMKATPRDFWPTFPHNAMIGRLASRPQWIEYDTFGQFYGWGVCPSIMIDDIRDRFDYARSRGVSGVLLRTEWEGVRVSSFDTINRINLICAAGWAVDPGQPGERFVESWLRDVADKTGTREMSADVAGLTRFLLRTWPLMRKTIYVDDFVFATSSQFPIDVSKAWFTMSFYHCLSTWDPSAAGRIDLDAANVRRLVSQKDDAARDVQSLMDYLGHHSFGLSSPAYEVLKAAFQFYPRYVQGFALAAKIVLLAKALGQEQQDSREREELADMLAALLRELQQYIDDLRRFEEGTAHEFYVYLVMNYRFAQGICEEAGAILEGFRAGRPAAR